MKEINTKIHCFQIITELNKAGNIFDPGVDRLCNHLQRDRNRNITILIAFSDRDHNRNIINNGNVNYRFVSFFVNIETVPYVIILFFLCVQNFRCRS